MEASIDIEEPYGRDEPCGRAARLLDWYDRHARALPWRYGAGERPDPYRVWLSEIMLQQTTVAAVIPYFETFTRRWPDVEALAAAPESEVMAAWAGLGYYRRARNLVACAREVARQGGFPGEEVALRALPGIGDYTAAAIAAIAFGQRAVVIDANVERVVSRLFAIDEPLPAGRKAIRAATDRITPSRRSGDFAQAMMDLGAQICTARDPRCMICPLSGDCAASRSGDPARFPVKPARKQRPERSGRAFWIERDDKVWLVARPDTGMLAGMRALPDDGWSARADGSGHAPLPGDWEGAGSVQHAFTHVMLTLEVMAYRGRDWPDCGAAGGEWWSIDRLDEAGLPTVFAKAAQRVKAAKESL